MPRLRSENMPAGRFYPSWRPVPIKLDKLRHMGTGFACGRPHISPADVGCGGVRFMWVRVAPESTREEQDFRKRSADLGSTLHNRSDPRVSPPRRSPVLMLSAVLAPSDIQRRRATPAARQGHALIRSRGGEDGTHDSRPHLGGMWSTTWGCSTSRGSKRAPDVGITAARPRDGLQNETPIVVGATKLEWSTELRWPSCAEGRRVRSYRPNRCVRWRTPWPG